MAKILKNFSDKSLFNPGNVFLNNVNVAAIGQINSLLQAAGVTIGMGGQDDIGKRIVLADVDGPDWSLASVGTLFGGIYQLVQVDSAATGANIFTGAAAFLLDTAAGGAANSGSNNYVVTDSAHALGTSHCVGVFLNAITPGNFGFIQISGKASVLYGAAIASASLAATVLAASATAGAFDNVVAAITGITLAQAIGVPIQVPVVSTLKTIQMFGLRARY